MSKKIHYLFKNYFEIAAFSMGLLLLVLMDPEAANGPSLCLFDQLGIKFCPGDGLGHAIAFIFEGEFYKSFNSNALGGPAIVILVGRIGYLLHQKLIANKTIKI
ncbi:Protein of unknown function (DUF2752) [Fodinibius salinus]|uniref:DUF2752 domain-containing protein n=1 Tax=Fodinibius salinus TaxID=860790 RepID=A0A5D3YMS6_9BACT|nr:Protein of unknown function (DUF2752) [Fodinibius salinus]